EPAACSADLTALEPQAPDDHAIDDRAHRLDDAYARPRRRDPARPAPWPHDRHHDNRGAHGSPAPDRDRLPQLRQPPLHLGHAESSDPGMAPQPSGEPTL